MPHLTFVLGGSRSGKSRFAQGLPGPDSKVVFWATGIATDPEMQRRIDFHRQSRPKQWSVIEEPRDLLQGLGRVNHDHAQYVVFDSLTTWVGNLLVRPDSNGKPIEHLRLFLERLAKSSARWIIVSDEVGMSVVPATGMGRAFRDVLGDANQIVAAASDQVYWVNAGIPLKIKGPSSP